MTGVQTCALRSDGGIGVHNGGVADGQEQEEAENAGNAGTDRYTRKERGGSWPAAVDSIVGRGML